MRFTGYFETVRQRADRFFIALEWIQRVIDDPTREILQEDGRIRLWGPIVEMDGRYLRVVLLPDRITVHNALFDRRFRP